jgi:hypothetical protein
MDFIETLDGLLAACAPNVEGLELVYKSADGTWTAAFSDDTIATIHADLDRNRLTVVMTVAPLTDANREPIMHGLLTYAMMWKETGGVRMGLGGNQVFILADLVLADVSEQSAAVLLANLHAKARIWAGFVAKGTMTADTGDMDPMTMIRI